MVGSPMARAATLWQESDRWQHEVRSTAAAASAARLRALLQGGHSDPSHCCCCGCCCRHRRRHPPLHALALPQGYPSIFNDKAVGGLGMGFFSVQLPRNASGELAQEIAEVQATVQAGYIVRARADSDTVEARANYTARLGVPMGGGWALASTLPGRGCQWVGWSAYRG